MVEGHGFDDRSSLSPETFWLLDFVGSYLFPPFMTHPFHFEHFRYMADSSAGMFMDHVPSMIVEARRGHRSPTTQVIGAVSYHVGAVP